MFPYTRTLNRKRVIVNLADRAFRGIMWARRGPLLILRDVDLIDGAQTIAVDGEVVVDRAHVEWVQVLP